MTHVLAYTLDAAYCAAHDKASDTGIPQHIVRVGTLYEVTPDPLQCNDMNYVDTTMPPDPCEGCQDPAFDGGEFCCAACSSSKKLAEQFEILPDVALAKLYAEYDPTEDSDSELVGNPPEEDSCGRDPIADAERWAKPDELTGRCHWCGEPCEPGGGFAECDDFCVTCGEMYGRPEK